MTRRSMKQMSPGMQFFFGRIFPLVFVIVGAAVIYKGAVNIYQAKQSTSWLSTQGEIKHSSVERRHSSGGGRHRRSSTTYHAKISYDFTVNNKTMSGTRVAFGDYGSSSRSHAENIVNMYPQGRAVTVYFKPDDPHSSVLESGIKFQTFFMPLFGQVFFGAGVFMAVSLPKAMKKQAAQAAAAGSASSNQQPETIEIQPPQDESYNPFFPESSMGALSGQNRYPGQS